MPQPPVALSIAGSDSSAGAGVQADLRVFHALGVVGCSAITAVTVQDTLGVHRVHPLPVELVIEQARVVIQDLRPAVVKIGMLGQGELAGALSELLAEHPELPVVWDPVLRSSSGHSLIEGSMSSLVELASRCVLMTPNLQEARDAQWVGRGHCSTLVTGEEVEGGFRDRLHNPQGALLGEWTRPAVQTRNDHGTGCTLSSAIAACLARGLPLPDACGVAGDWVNRWLQQSSKLRLGQGRAGMQHGLAFPALEI